MIGNFFWLQGQDSVSAIKGKLAYYEPYFLARVKRPVKDRFKYSTVWNQGQVITDVKKFESCSFREQEIFKGSKGATII